MHHPLSLISKIIIVFLYFELGFWFLKQINKNKPAAQAAGADKIYPLSKIAVTLELLVQF